MVKHKTKITLTLQTEESIWPTTFCLLILHWLLNYIHYLMIPMFPDHKSCHLLKVTNRFIISLWKSVSTGSNILQFHAEGSSSRRQKSAPSCQRQPGKTHMILCFVSKDSYLPPSMKVRYTPDLGMTGSRGRKCPKITG